MKFAAVVLSLLIAPRAVARENLQGEWHGAIEIKGGAPLRLALHVQERGGRLDVTVDSVDEGGAGLHVDGFHLEGSTVKFAMDAAGVGLFSGPDLQVGLPSKGSRRHHVQIAGLAI
jgi:hypothetical protein